MSTSDIRPFGAGQGVGFYYVKHTEQFGHQDLVLVAIDELGNVQRTTARRDFDEAAPTEGEAVIQHLAPAVKQADADLRKRQEAQPKEAEAKPEPMSPATARFYEDPDW